MKAAEEEPLGRLWRRQFLAELDRKIQRAREAAACTSPDGWYRSQIDEAIRMYEAARIAAASTGSEKP